MVLARGIEPHLLPLLVYQSAIVIEDFVLFANLQPAGAKPTLNTSILISLIITS